MMLGAISSVTGLSQEVLIALITISASLLILYIFYPAISLSFADISAVRGETMVSSETTGKAMKE